MRLSSCFQSRPKDKGKEIVNSYESEGFILFVRFLNLARKLPFGPMFKISRCVATGFPLNNDEFFY